MRTETIICNRCRRDAKSVPDCPTHDGVVVGGFNLYLRGGSLDLCPECFAAFLAWVELGDNYENQS